MANEITLNATLAVSKDSFKTSFQPGTLRVTLTSEPAFSGVLAIGTSAESVTLTDISTAGYACFRNLASTSSTSYVELGVGTTSSPQMFVKLKPSEYAISRLASTVLIAKATGAAVNLQTLILSD